MDIKRRLNKIAKCLTPEIENMNISYEMKNICSRLEELIRYADEKIARTERRLKAGEKSGGQAAANRKAAAAKVIKDHQDAEAEENQKDQQESLDERNARLSKSKPDTHEDTHEDAHEDAPEDGAGSEDAQTQGKDKASQK